jgi:hypothetical protein
MVKIIIYLVALLCTSNLYSQSLESKYEPNIDHPYGLPNPASPMQLLDYKDLIGVCDCVSVRKNPDQTWGDSVAMRWEWRYVLNGTAVQDITYRADNSSSSSMRQYNADSASWYVTYFNSLQNSAKPNTWSGGLDENGDMVLKVSQKAPNGLEGHSILSFKNISKEGFNWTADWEAINGNFRTTYWEINCRKRK